MLMRAKKTLHTKMNGKKPKGRPRTRRTDQIRKNIEIRGENWEKYKKTGSGRRETAVDFSVIVDPYLWK